MRRFFIQAVFLIAVLAVLFELTTNAYVNLRDRGITTGFTFLTEGESNFTISETGPIPIPGTDAPAALIVFFLVILTVFGLRHWGRTHYSANQNIPTLRIIALILLVVLPLLGLTVKSLGLSLISVGQYAPPSTYLMAFLTGLFNTLRLSLLSIIFGTIVGFIIGIGRLSNNWLIRSLSGTFIEITRNIPLLLQLFFWYFGIMLALPNVHESLIISDILILNNRGISMPSPTIQEGFQWFMLATLGSIIGTAFYIKHTRRQYTTGTLRLSTTAPILTVFIGIPAMTWFITGQPIGFDYPELGRFNYWGGINLTPEFSAMLIGLTLYSGGFIAEIVRSGIQAIPRGQTEAARALGLTYWDTLRLVVLPQARRIMIPPLTSTYLGTIKDSSLGVAVGYPELVTISGTIIDASGQAIENLLILIVFYMSVTLLVSAAMSMYATRIRTRTHS